MPSMEQWPHATSPPVTAQGARRQHQPGCWFSVWWLLLSSRAPSGLGGVPNNAQHQALLQSLIEPGTFPGAEMIARLETIFAFICHCRLIPNCLSGIFFASPIRTASRLSHFLPLPPSCLGCIGCAVSQPCFSWLYSAFS